MRNRKGFTIVELMVVIGILSVVLAILMPGLARAREHANRMRCQANLRQLLLACAVYESDWEEACPWSNWMGPEIAGYRPTGWLYRYPQGTNLAACADDVTSGSLFLNVTTTRAYHCPADDGPRFGPTELLSSFLINGATCGYGRHLPCYRITAFRPDAIMFWEADPFAAPWTSGAAYPSHGLASRHDQGGSIGCYDGHVEWMSDANFAQEEQKLPGRLWCNPGTRTGT